MRRRLLASLLILLVLIGGGVTAYWYIACRQLADGFAAWAQAQTPAWQFTNGTVAFAGWPVRAILVVPQLRLVGGASYVPGGLSWRADRVRLVVPLLHPWTLDVLADGEQRIGSALEPGKPYTAALTRLRFPLHSAGSTADLRVEQLRAAGEVSAGIIQALLTFDPRAAKTQPAIDATISAQTIALPPDVHWPLGPRIADINLIGALEGPLPPPRDLTDDAKAWRDGGGAVSVRQLALRWGPLDAVIGGRVALDAAMQPVATGQAVITSYAQLLDGLAARHVIGNDAALAAKAVLSLLSETQPGGGPSEVQVPFAVRDGLLSVHGISLARLPAVQWPSL
jgi:hypothetical protein